MQTSSALPFALITGIALCCASCGRFGSTETAAPVVEDVAQPVVSKKQASSTGQPASDKPRVAVAQSKKPQSTAPIAPNLFRTPADDIKLPTDAEMEEGKESAAANQPAGQSKSAPSISVKPSGPQAGSEP